ISTAVPEVKTEVSRVTTEVSYLTTEVPLVTKEPPYVTTKGPEFATEVPRELTEVPYVTTEDPELATNVPHVITEVPHTITEVTDVVTEVPHVITEAPHVVTEVPHVITEVPRVTTEAPEGTSKVPGGTTKAPSVATKITNVTTKVSTAAPDWTTKASEVTTEPLEVTTPSPEATTKVSTASSKATTKAPEVITESPTAVPDGKTNPATDVPVETSCDSNCIFPKASTNQATMENTTITPTNMMKQVLFRWYFTLRNRHAKIISIAIIIPAKGLANPIIYVSVGGEYTFNMTDDCMSTAFITAYDKESRKTLAINGGTLLKECNKLNTINNIYYIPSDSDTSSTEHDATKPDQLEPINIDHDNATPSTRPKTFKVPVVLKTGLVRYTTMKITTRQADLDAKIPGSVAGFVLLFALGLVVYLLLRRRSHNRPKEESMTPEKEHLKENDVETIELMRLERSA
ncbi:uncharacterized protein LOC114542939, partial [Dendronephthya gigantea]|uniref:uncharacterized protein LOC114542939 n=1 Tax=Dendronephthya gigantea TaxID=151771 RepID=UPI001068FDAB